MSEYKLKKKERKQLTKLYDEQARLRGLIERNKQDFDMETSITLSKALSHVKDAIKALEQTLRIKYQDFPDKKKCSDCKKSLPWQEFGFNVSNADGLQWQCKTCRRIRNRRAKDTGQLQERFEREVREGFDKFKTRARGRFYKRIKDRGIESRSKKRKSVKLKSML